MAPRHERAGPEHGRTAAAGPPAGATPALIRWGAVIGGGIIGLSLLVLLTALWMALGFGSGLEAIQSNLDWLVALSAVVALFAGGLLAGWLAGVPGFAPGLFNGLAVWGVVLTISLIVGTPSALQTVGISDASMGAVPSQALWAGFVAMLIGALAAALGGGVGGITTRPAFVYAAPPAPADTHRDEEARTAEPTNGGRETRETRIEEGPARGRRAREPEEAPTNGGAKR